MPTLSSSVLPTKPPPAAAAHTLIPQIFLLQYTPPNVRRIRCLTRILLGVYKIHTRLWDPPSLKRPDPERATLQPLPPKPSALLLLTPWEMMPQISCHWQAWLRIPRPRSSFGRQIQFLITTYLLLSSDGSEEAIDILHDTTTNKPHYH